MARPLVVETHQSEHVGRSLSHHQAQPVAQRHNVCRPLEPSTLRAQARALRIILDRFVDPARALGRFHSRLESVNALVEERCAKVDSWKSSNQRRRWLATALLDVEPRLRRVKGCQHLPKLQTALRRVLNIKVSEVSEKAA